MAEQTVAPKERKRCAYFWERRTRGKRFVNNRGQCKSFARVGKSYCSTHGRMHGEQ